MAHIDAGQDDHDRADPLLHRRHPQDGRGRTTAPPPPTGWCRSASAASPSPPPRSPPSGAGRTSKYRDQHHRHARATWTSPSRWSAPCACSTAPSRVFDGVNGVEPQRETVWRQADQYKVPRICFINKMDRRGRGLRDVGRHHPGAARGARRCAVQLPLGAEDTAPGRHRPRPDEGASCSRTTEQGSTLRARWTSPTELHGRGRRRPARSSRGRAPSRTTR